MFADRALDLERGRLDVDPRHVSRLDVCTGQRVLEKGTAWIGHQETIVVLDVFGHEPPKRRLVIIVDSARPRVLHMIHGRTSRNLVECHRIDVIVPYIDRADDGQGREAVDGLVSFFGRANLALEFIFEHFSGGRHSVRFKRRAKGHVIISKYFIGVLHFGP